MSDFRLFSGARTARLCSIAAVAALGTTGLVAGTSTSGSAQTADRGLRLISTTDEIEAYSDGDGYVYFEPSVWLAAYGQGYEFWSKRAKYSDPVSVTKTVIRGNKRTTTKVPAKLVDGFGGFKNGVRTTVTGVGGKILSTSNQNLCPGGYDPQRVDPTGPSEPTYPTYCYGNWFTKATVFGIDQGWAVRPNSDGDYGFLETNRKQFNITTRISGPVADFLGIPAGSRSVTQHVVVVDDGGCGIAAGCRTAPTDRQARGTSDVPRSLAAKSSTTRKAAPATTSGKPAADTLPDLISLPAWGINTEGEKGDVDRLNFNANEWNGGPAPMVVEGYRQGKKPIMDAYQVFYRNGKAVSTKKTGTMEFHDEAEHNHWHFLDFARYDLVKPDGTFVTTSGKQSWCLAPTDPVDLSRKNAVWRPGATGLESTCGDQSALWLRETMPVGWGDTYSQYQTQAFDLTGVKNGTYKIKITVNPNGNLFEKTKANNVSLRTVKIGGKPGARTVKVPPYQGVDTETGF